MDAETQEIRQARQRASVSWLLSKAFNNRVPDNLKEPFYRDHESKERLKPQIIVELGNGTLYCQTLSNLYSDPNYQSLNHWSILQTLSRKGVPVKETPDMPITETVLIQTNPLRINAHMLVIESLMLLYAKEIASGERITNAIRRISGNSSYQIPLGQNAEQQLLSWISYACAALKKRIANDIEAGLTDENGLRLQTPDIPPVNDFQSLCDGICLALLISYYCPKVLPWSSVRINYLPAVEDSIHNILLVNNFSQKHLPYNVFHMTPEDVTYMRGSMKLNLVVLLTDLFNLFEIHPAKCVSYPGMDASVSRSASTGVIMRKSMSTTTSSVDFQPFDSPNHLFHNHNNNEEAFVVHKSRGITTLSSMHSQQQQQQQQQIHHHLQHQTNQQQQQLQQQQQQMEPLVPARLRQAKEKTNMETKADERGDYPVVAAGRPSNWDQNRRPSYAGRRSRRNSSSEDSQLTIENFGGSQDQINMIGRYERDRDRDRERKLSNTSIEPAVAVRSSIADARGTLQLGYDTDSGSEKQDRETEKYYMRRQASIDNVSLAAHNNSHNNEPPSSSSHRGHSIDKDFNDSLSDSKAPIYEHEIKLVRKSSTASMPVNSSWQQDLDPYDDDTRSLENASKLSTIRMKLEEKRRRIEQDKRRYELALMRQQEKDDLESEMGRWETLSNESKRTPDMDPLEMDKYQQTYGSQQHLAAGDPYINPRPIQQNFGSSPHIPQTFQQQQQQQQVPPPSVAAANPYNSRPPSRDPYMQQQQQQQHNTMQYINEHGQYMSPQQHPQSGPHMTPPLSQTSTQNLYMQPQSLYGDSSPYNSNHLGGGGGGVGVGLAGGGGGYPGQYTNSNHPHHPAMMMQHGMSMGGVGVNVGLGMNSYLNNRSAGGGGSYDDYGILHQGRALDPNSSSPAGNHFYLHEQQQQSQQQQQQPQPPQRRTWGQTEQPQQSQQQQQGMVDINAWQSQKKQPTWMQQQQQQQQHQQQQQGFILHQNGGGGEFQHLFQVHSSPQHLASNTNTNNTSTSTSTSTSTLSSNKNNSNNIQMAGVQRQHSMTSLRDSRTNLNNTLPRQQNLIKQQQQQQQQLQQHHQQQQQQCLNDDMMAPQSICFIGDDEDIDDIERDLIETMHHAHISHDYQTAPTISQQQHHQNMILINQNNSNTNNNIHNTTTNNNRGSSSEDYDSNEMILIPNVSSGNLTYRMNSPNRPALQNNSFQDPRDDKTPEKGFYISFDDDQPKRPKPPLRAKRSPKKERSLDSVDHQIKKRESLSQLHNNSLNTIENHNGIIATSIDNKHQQHQQQQQNHGFLSSESKATYNKYTDGPPVNLKQLSNVANHHHQQQQQNSQQQLSDQSPFSHQQQSAPAPLSPLKPQSPTHATLLRQQQESAEAKAKALVIGADTLELDPESVDEMERKKEKILMLSLQRRQQQEEAKARKEIEAQKKRELERQKEEEKARKKEEQMARRAAILEQHRLKKAIEEAEREGKTLDREMTMKQQASQSASVPRLRQQRNTRPRPKTIHVDDGSVDISEASSISSRGKKGSTNNLTGYGQYNSAGTMKRDLYKGSQDSLAIKEPTSTASERGRTLSRISIAKGSTLNLRGRKSSSLMNLCDSGLGRATPPRRAPSPGMASTSSGSRHLPSPSGPGSLPPGLISKRRIFDDGSSDNSIMDYSGPKLYKQPAAKSNRGIILNAVEYCVFPGAVNRDAKQKVLEKIARSEAKHFLVLFRDAGCQFRALYSYVPETEQVTKLYGTGPSQVDEVMFDKFFKYNSGGKCFSQVHTKHLTVTIDAFTIHNSLWQGKKLQLPSKKDMALVI